MKRNYLHNYNNVACCWGSSQTQPTCNRFSWVLIFKKGYSLIQVSLFCFGIPSFVKNSLNTEINLSYN